MSQSRTAAFIAAAEAATRHTKPVVLVRALLAGGTRYWTSRGGQYPSGGQYYSELLSSGIRISLGLDNLGRAQRGFGSIELSNGLDGAGSRASDLFATEVLANAAVEIDYLFHGLTHPTDSLRLFTGALDIPEERCFDDRSMVLNALDDGNPLHAGIQALKAGRVHKVLGERLTATTYPNIDPDYVGRVRPEIYGALTDAPGYPVDAGVCDVLAVAVAAGGTSLVLSDAARFALLPASGTLQCEAEQIAYTTLTPATLTVSGLTRGSGGTTAAAHAAGKQVWEVKAGGYKYEFARHACKSLDTVKVDGVAIDPASYTTSLTGPTTITFTGKPTRALDVAVTTQPTFSATTTAEQSPGTVTVSAEQGPGNISTSAEQGPGLISTVSEQGASTDTGSHGHTYTASQYQVGSGGFPRVISATYYDFTFNDLPNDSECVWQVVWSTCYYPTGGSVTYNPGQTWSGGATPPSVWTYSGGVGTNTLRITIAGTGSYITVESVTRTVTYGPATQNAAASGVVTSLTGYTGSTMPALNGATASSMAALSGSTAANMATLSGSTAISLGQTQNVVVSAADVVVGERVTADIEGWADDGSGTYTGTPNALIINWVDQVRHLLCHADYLALTAATYIDATTFAAARAASAAAGIRCDWGLYDQIPSEELLERLRWSVAGWMFQGAAGAFKVHQLPLAGNSQKTFTEGADVPDEKAGGGPIQVGRTSLADLYNQVIALGAKRLNGNGYGTTITTYNTPSQTTYRMTRTLLVENDFIRDTAALTAIAGILLGWHKDQKWRATVYAAAEVCVHLEPCDKVSITSTRMPGGWTAKAFWVERIALEVCRPNLADLVTLVMREV